MNDNNITFKTVLYVDEKIVAESTDLTLWQNVLSHIKSGNITSLNKPMDVIDNNNEVQSVKSEEISDVEKFSKEVEIDCDKIMDACNPSIEAPFIRLDMKTWENYKRKHFENKRPLPDVVIVATILALWKKCLNLGDVTQKEVLTVLKQLNITATNPTRSYKNCEWLKYDSNKISLMATKYSLARKMLADFCDSI